MVKNIKKIALTFFLSSSLFALTEGVEYNIAENPIPNSKNSLTEIWSYTCSHCYLHQAYGTLDIIKDQIKDLKINMMMVKSWGEFGKEMANLLAYAEYKDSKEKLTPNDEKSNYYNVSRVYFVEIFKNNKTWKNSDDFYSLGLEVLGISKKSLDKFLETPEGKYLISSTDVAEDIAMKVGTPAFVVNGKYIINLAHVSSPQDLIDLINELLKLK